MTEILQWKLHHHVRAMRRNGFLLQGINLWFRRNSITLSWSNVYQTYGWRKLSKKRSLWLFKNTFSHLTPMPHFPLNPLGGAQTRRLTQGLLGYTIRASLTKQQNRLGASPQCIQPPSLAPQTSALVLF